MLGEDLKACPWAPKTSSSINPSVCFTHNDFGSCYLPLRGSSSSLGSARSKSTFPNHSQGIIAMQTNRFLCSSESLQHCFHPSIQRCSEFRSAPLTEAVLGGFQSPGGDGGSVRRWMRLGRGKRGSQKQERPSTPLPFAFITLQTIYPVAPGQY